MSTNRIAMIAATMALAGLFFARPVRADNPPVGPNGQALKIGVANAGTIAGGLQETKDLLAKRQQQQKDLNDQKTQKEQEIEQLKQQLALLNPTAPEYVTTSHNLLTKSIEYDAWTKETELFLQRQQKTDIKRLYAEIQDAIKEVALTKGLNLVIADQGMQIPDKVDDIDIQTLQSIIGRQTVLYSDGTLDISGEVKALLDRNYLNKNQPTTPAVPPPVN